MSDFDQDLRAFLSHVDALTDRLQPKRRPRDAGAPECSLRELRALTALGRHGRLTMSVLAGLLDVPLSTATRIVERLVAKGLVERGQSGRDRRIVEVGFGQRGRRINQYVEESRRAEAESMLGALSASERATLLRQLARLVDARAPKERRR
ncbi:MAG TPA: MarR family transcriptional regulator [Gammaproteobacteria bacterium]|nr:MarR family transcriptional regulator [Gammaproteobacteria bacterium]